MRSRARGAVVILLFVILFAGLFANRAPAAPAVVDPFEAQLAARTAAWTRDFGKPEGALAVLGAIDLWSAVEPHDVAAFLEDAASTPLANPLAQAHAIHAAQLAALRFGDDARAAGYRERLGTLTAWRVIGPFGFDGGDNHGTVFGPEVELQGTATHLGKRGEVAWREVPPQLQRAATVPGTVPLDAMLRPATKAVAYGLTWIYTDKARDVAVRVATTGRVKVWVGGRMVLDRDVADRPLRFDQDAAAARLEIGWNPILIKVTVEDGAWGFSARVTELDGKALALRSAVRPEPTVAGKAAAQAKPAAATKAKVVDLRTLLTARARKAAKGAAREAAWRDVALYLEAVAPDRPDDKPVEAALIEAGLDSAGASPLTLLVAARHAETPDVRRRAAERASESKAASAPQRAEALTHLGAYYSDEAGQPRRARELYTAALAADPGAWPAELLLARELVAIDLPETARRRVALLAAARPTARTVRRVLADLDERRGRPADAEKLLSDLREGDRSDASLLTDLADLARARGDAGASIAWLREAVLARPAHLGLYVDLGDALLDSGDVAGALAAYDAALALCPDEANVLEASGRALIDKGTETQEQEGLGRLKHALAIRPQNPALRQYLSRVLASDSAYNSAYNSDLEKQYARDAREVIATHRDWNVGTGPSTVLLDLKVTRVHQNGLSETLVQRIVRVDDENGALAHQAQQVQYTPSTQAVEIRTARVFKQGGEILEAKERGVNEVSEPWYGLYYDIRAEVVSFERLDPGDVVEFVWVLSDDGAQNLFADYFGDIHYFVEDVPRAEVEYTLLAPEKRALYFQLPKVDALEQTEDLVDGPDHKEKRYRFRAHLVPKITWESGMPGWTEVAPFLHVSTYRNWNEVARWYWGLIKEQLVSDDAVRKAAQAAVKGIGAADTAAKVRAVHNLVVKSTRYVGLEFGIHGFKPYRVPQVFARKFGDCKDKASLIVVMLREVGIEAQVVLVRTRKNGDVGEHPASLAVFDHAIAYVPALDLFLDGTAEFSGSQELPSEDQGVTVLVIDGAPGGDGGRFARTPVLPADRNKFARTHAFTVGKDGKTKLVESAVITGQAAQEWRRYYQSAGDRRDRYEKVWNAAWAGARVDKVTMPDLAELEKPVTVHAEGTIPEFGTATGTAKDKGRLSTAFGKPSELARSYARASRREHDLVLDYPWLQDEHTVYELAAGASFDVLPSDAAITSDFGKFVMKVQPDAGGRKLTITYTLQVNRRRITVAEYAKWRAFLLAVDDALNQPLGLRL